MAKAKARWTARDDNELRRLRIEECRPVRAVAAALKRTPAAVAKRLRGFKLVGSRTAWTRSEERTLIRLRVEGGTLTQIATALGRTRSAVVNRVGVLGLAKVKIVRGTRAAPVRRLHARGFNDSEIADRLGMSVSGVWQVRKRLNLPPTITPAEAGRRGGVVRCVP